MKTYIKFTKFFGFVQKIKNSNSLLYTFFYFLNDPYSIFGDNTQRSLHHVYVRLKMRIQIGHNSFEYRIYQNLQIFVHIKSVNLIKYSRFPSSQRPFTN